MEVNKNKELLLLAFFLQLFLIILSNAYKLLSIMSINLFGMPANLINILNFFSVIITIYLVYNTLKLSQKEQELVLLKKEQIHTENLSLFLREFKHDLNNQIFVANGLIQLGKVEEAAAFSEELSEQFNWMEALLKLNQPEFASLVLNKMMEAKNQGIGVEVNIATDDISKIPKDILTRCVGNILDNAIEAMKNNDFKLKQLVLELYPKKDYLLVSIENTGEVPPEIAENMFQRGFSTKEDEKDHGLGLHIVKTLMESIGGKVTHENQEGTTIFQLQFPIKAV